MNFKKEYVYKALKCCSLLPPPREAVVRQFAEDWLELEERVTELEGITGRVHALERCIHNRDEALTIYEKELPAAEEEVARMKEMAKIIEEDPHQWSKRPCATCRRISQMLGRPFGCSAKDCLAQKEE